jgi:nitrite reductase/ring-hydroxylating ferredoxin subunit
MIMRGITRYVEDLIRSRRPRRFAADEDSAGLARTAITLRAARPGSGAPREEFVLGLHKRLARELDPPGPAPVAGQASSGRASSGRRAFLRAATVTGGVAVAGGAALAGAGAEHALTARSAGPLSPAATLIPDNAEWRTVALSAELPDGALRHFTVGAVPGFVSRDGGQLRAVSGICPHQGCLLTPGSPDPRKAGRPATLACPCHGATFAADGTVLTHRLRFPLTDLTVLEVREAGDAVQVLAPSGNE